MSHRRSRHVTWPHRADNGDELTYDEGRAITALQELARRWPRALKLASVDGSLAVVRDKDGRNHSENPGIRAESVLARINGIPSDGGAW